MCTGFRQGGFAHRPILLDNMSPFYSRAYPYKMRLSIRTTVKHVGVDLSIGLEFIKKCVDTLKSAPACVKGVACIGQFCWTT